MIFQTFIISIHLFISLIQFSSVKVVISLIQLNTQNKFKSQNRENFQNQKNSNPQIVLLNHITYQKQMTFQNRIF